MQIIAHRGGSARAPENTFAAFDNALAMGAHAFEFDLRRSADDAVFVIHDATLDRTTNGHGPVCETPGDAIMALDAGFWFSSQFEGEPVPLFRDVLSRYKDKATLHIEIKDNCLRLAGLVAEIMRDEQAFEQCWVTSFHPEVLSTLRSFAPDARLAQVTRKQQVWTPQALLAAQVQMVCPHAQLVTAALVDAYHAAGLLVRPWGLKGDAALLDSLRPLGVYGVTWGMSIHERNNA